jgi:hypothetical protein
VRIHFDTAIFRDNWREIAVIGFAALFLTLGEYHTLWNEWLSSLLLYAVLPLLVTVVVLRKNPLGFGWGPGHIRFWGWHVLGALAVIAPILYFSAREPSLQAYYRKAGFDLAGYGWQTFLYLLGWEYIFRGFLLFGLKDRLRETSILIQVVPFVLLHIGKPELETLSCIFTGAYFGYVCYRGNSFWPAFIIHVFINVFFVAVVNLS